jgi:hypothetical protein
MDDKKKIEEDISENLENLKKRIENQRQALDKFINAFNEAKEKKFSKDALSAYFGEYVDGALKNTANIVTDTEKKLKNWLKK